MRTSTRIAIAVLVLLFLGALAAGGWWYQTRQRAASTTASTLTVNVTSAADRGPGTLREALFIVAAATGKADVLLKVPAISLETALPPLVNPHGVRIVGLQGGTQIDAHALSGAPVFDVAGDNTALEGLQLKNCSGGAVLLRATQFHMRGTALEGCDVGVDVAENARDVLIEHNRFTGGRIGVRFAASAANTVIAGNVFTQQKDAGLWAVRAEPDARGSAITVRDNHFEGDRSGIVAANVAILIERNEFADNPEGAIHLLGAGAVVRANHIGGGPGMGIIAENASEALIEDNELDHLVAYGIMVRGSANVLLRGNRVHNCGYGLAFVLGDPRRPSTAQDNTIIEPQFNGIDVIGDSPILRHNQVLQPRAFALHVTDFQQPDGRKVASRPFLENNNFRAESTAVASGAAPTAVRQP
ncbi:MAG TPA: right-handed parallel beta-helix repeat-containing protein [Steroidobacteraceae bacterium]|jgi:parallel beta-helix repeat protein|nr:right-handed parallel beta-helix repeat-containing protein [Steroidobacteraceae bacterium]